MEYSVLNIFSKTDIEILNEVYNEQKEERIKRYHNLFYMVRRNFGDKLISNTFKQKLRDYGYEFEDARFYFLEYSKGSFTRAHRDDPGQSQKTLITMIDKSDDLKGGETIVYKNHWKKENYVYDLNRYHLENEDDHQQGASIIPVVINLNVGDTVVYDERVKHEVCEVEQGHRRVFVAWLT